MAYNAHQLPIFVKEGENWRVTLYVDTTIGALTVPTDQTIKDIEDFGEALESEDERGKGELAGARFSIRDDYKTYAAGFWYTALAKTAEIEIEIEYLGSYWHAFRGQIDKDRIKWEPHQRADGTYFRRASFTVTSRARAILSQTLTADWITEILAQKQATGLNYNAQVYTVITFQKFFAALMKVAFNGTFDASDCELIYDTNKPAIEYKQNVTWYKADSLCFPVEFDLGVSPTHDVRKVPYFDSASPFYLATAIPNAYEVLSQTAGNFGFHARILQDPNGSRWKIQLIQKGHTYATAITPVGIVKSFDEVENTELDTVATQAFRRANGELVHVSDRAPASPRSSNPSADVEFDITITCLWVINPSTGIYWGISVVDIYDYMVTSGGAKFTDVRYYRYDTKATASTSITGRKLQEALAMYHYCKYKKSEKGLLITYNSMKATNVTTTFFQVVLGGRITISSVDYYILEIKRRVKIHELFLRLDRYTP